MANDSELFRTREELEAEGFELRQPGKHFVRGETVFLPLYEGKMFQSYDHRAASVIRDESNRNRPGQPLETDPELKFDPTYSPTPEYWVGEDSLESGIAGITDLDWFLSFKAITSATNRRTMIATAVPYCAIHDNTPLLIPERGPAATVKLLPLLNCHAFDYATRQKTNQPKLMHYVVKQLPVIPPSRYEEEFCGERLADVVAGRVLELVYTAWDIRAFARDLGDEGPPFVWDEERRAQLRAQLDAIYWSTQACSWSIS
jgi:hypothetical protein